MEIPCQYAATTRDLGNLFRERCYESIVGGIENPDNHKISLTCAIGARLEIRPRNLDAKPKDSIFRLTSTIGDVACAAAIRVSFRDGRIANPASTEGNRQTWCSLPPDPVCVPELVRHRIAALVLTPLEWLRRSSHPIRNSNSRCFAFSPDSKCLYHVRTKQPNLYQRY